MRAPIKRNNDETRSMAPRQHQMVNDDKSMVSIAEVAKNNAQLLQPPKLPHPDASGSIGLGATVGLGHSRRQPEAVVHMTDNT